MALQIRRAHRFLPPSQDHIALRASDRTNREKVLGTFSISLVAGGLVLCLCQLISASNAESAEKWLIYTQGITLPGGQHLLGYSYYGYFEVPGDQVGSLDILGRTNDIWDKINKPTSAIERNKKPTITRNDNAYMVAFFDPSLDKPLICTKTEAAFKQSDAPVVPPETTVAVKTIVAGATAAAKAFPCDLETRDKGNTKITFTVEKQLTDTTKGELLKGTVLVHELYRFRIISGPVFSSLITKNRTFSTITNAAGQQVISSSRANDSPANFPVFLKTYWARDGRDILVDPTHWYSPERFNPIIGINLVNNPLKNFYVGLSYEPILGVDIVAGAHFAKIDQLAGGFSDGQVVPAGTQPPTTSKFLTGGFVGVTADVGVIGSWLGSQITKTIKEGFR
ncbi:MAG: hypothetical protein HOP35_18115 [Nitrospira sp.]|nr:hypothetical protein [Nitrospira sp.]